MSIEELDLGEPKVEPICEQLGTSERVRKAAEEQARRVDREYALNHKGSIVAASSVYFQSLMCNEKVTQPQVAEAANVSEHSIRECYRRIAEHEGITIEKSVDDAEAETQRENPGFLSWILKVVR